MRKLFFFLIVSLSFNLFSQESSDDDIKVGLVLSGGGAKGLAHIGALKVIEESGIRIDYIGGTSMGAIIGGLYAAGYTPDQLDSIFNKTNFNILIQDKIPRRSKSFYEKQESEKYALNLPFDRFKLGLPTGLSKGQNLYNLLNKLTSHVSHISDFSELPIPFFCVSTNVETGEEIILDKGYLPRAIAASGALPSVFNPVVIDDVIMIDGGVVNNYPVKEVRNKGMDIVIGVDVQDTLKTRDELQSAYRILTQINNFSFIRAMREKRGLTDVYLHPDIKDFTVLSFEDGKKIIESGIASAEEQKDIFDDIARRQKKQKAERKLIKQQDSIYIKKLIITGNKDYTRSYIMGKLRFRTPAKLSYSEFGEGINALSATGNFSSINYRMEGDPDKGAEVILNVTESPSKMSFKFAAHYDQLFKTAALANITRKRMFTSNDIMSLDIIIGDNVRYNFDYYIDKGYYWSVGLSSKYHFFDTSVPLYFLIGEYVDDLPIPLNTISINYSDFTNQLYFETIFKRSFIFGVGGEHKYLRFLSKTLGGDQLNQQNMIIESTNYLSTYGFLKYDSYDNAFFPTKGMYFMGDFHWYVYAQGRNADFEPFSIGKARAGYAHTLFKNFSAHIQAEGGFKFGRRGGSTMDFALGGYGFKEMNNIIPFIGYKAISLGGNTYLKSSLTFDYNFWRKNHLNVSANIANVGHDLFSTGEWIEEIMYYSFSAGYGFESILGPMELKYAYSPEREESEWHISLGYRF